jgi:hypothetical protein
MLYAKALGTICAKMTHNARKTRSRSAGIVIHTKSVEILMYGIEQEKTEITEMRNSSFPSPFPPFPPVIKSQITIE